MNAPSLVCPHRPPCPGCPRLGEPDLPADARAALSALATTAGLGGFEVVRGPIVGFRHRARLAVRGRAASPKVGIFETGSHRVVDIPRCLVHHPLVNEVAGALKRAMIATGATPYSDDAHRGLVRYVQVVVERRTQTAQVVLVTCDDQLTSSERLLDALSDKLGARLHSLFWNGNTERTNVILGPVWEKRRGPDAVEEMIGGARVFFPPGAFGQNNLELADALVSAVHGHVPDGARVLELYGGTGPIGLGLAARGASLVVNELSDDSLRGLEMGIRALPDTVRGRVRIAPGPAGDATRELDGADIVIVDPPRKGLDADVLAALCERPPEKLLYVACGREAFEGDATALLDTRKLRLSGLTAFDLFPHTEHVEVLGVFERFDGSR